MKLNTLIFFFVRFIVILIKLIKNVLLKKLIVFYFVSYFFGIRSKKDPRVEIKKTVLSVSHKQAARWRS